MISLTWLLSIILPIGLVIAGTILIRKRGNPDTTEQRYFLFLVWTALGMSVPIIINWLYPQLRFSIGVFFAPLIPALVAMMLLHASAWRDLSRRQKAAILFVLILMLLLGIAQFVFGSLVDAWSRLETTLQLIPFISLPVFLFIVWKWGNHYPFLFGIFSILYLILFNWFEVASLPLPDEATLASIVSADLMALVYLVVPGFVVTTMAMLILNMIRPSSKSGEAARSSRGRIVGQVLMFAILLGGILYTHIWLWIWDGMDDGVRFIFLWMATTLTVVSIELMIGLTSSGWRRWVGFPFAGIILAVIYGSVLGMGNRYSNYAMTENRARHIQEAIESFRVKTSWYPLDLNELTPREMLRIPRPMIVPGQKWCYQGGSNYYRLGLVYREHWSSPYFSVRVYASAGEIPDGSWECDEMLVAAKAKYTSGVGAPPPSNSLTESSVSIQKVEVEPILSGKSFSVGEWSPDGRYLVFGETEYFMDEVEQVTIDLHFIDSMSGAICQPSENEWTVRESDGLQGHYAWLADSHFLYVTDDGKVWTFKPCESDIKDWSSRFDKVFTGVVSFHANSGQVLVGDQSKLWLLSGNSLESRKTVEVPAESYRDWYAWSADGGRLAISILTAAEEGKPAFLYVINTESGEVEFNMPLQGVSDANLPIVDWLTRDELLLHSKTLIVMDFRVNPPARTDLIHDTFLLDIGYPIDVSSMDIHSGLNDYTLGLRVNHPHNQGAYVYDSKTGQVTVYEHDTHTLFFFPDGGWMRLFKWEDEPSYRDEYEMVWMDQSSTARRLVVEGHVPRNHPQMFPYYLPKSEQLVFSSSQGISLVSIPGGETTHFWTLHGADNAYSRVLPSPQENALAVFVAGVGLYYIPLDS